MSTLTENIALFLKEFHPFSYLDNQDLITIANEIKIISLDKNNTIFNIDDTLHTSFYVVSSGVINLTYLLDGEEILLNKCYVGDVFGLRPFFAKNNYKMTAKAREESIIYAIPIDVFKPYVSQNSQVLDFLLENFASNSKGNMDKDNNTSFSQGMFGSKIGEIQYLQSLSYNKTPLKINPDELIKDVAQKISDNLLDNAIIIENDLPIGIVTDSDFRSKIANGRFPINSPISKIMSSPVVTVPENISLAEAQLLLLKYNVSHLCVTKNGSFKSPVVGIISEHDLVVAQSNNPGVLLREIKRALSAKELKQIREKLTDLVQSSIAKDIPIPHIFNIVGEINFALLKRAIELAILDLGSPPARFCWLSIGSQARKEQLLPTDHDSILVFEDVAEEKYRDIKDYFVKLSKRTVAIIEKMGYQYCSNNHMASNLMWCKSVTEWIKQYNNWIKNPGEKSNQISSIFFDIEMITGEQKIEESLLENLNKNIKNNTLFFDYLGNDALRKQPSLTFFKKFNVEEEGEFKGKFDIKNKAILSLVDSARLLSLSLQLQGITNTYLRFKQLAILDPKYAEIYTNCAEAFLTLTHYKTEEGLKYDNSGQYLNVDELSKADKEKLKNALQPMRDLEDMIKDRFQLTQFS